MALIIDIKKGLGWFGPGAHDPRIDSALCARTDACPYVEIVGGHFYGAVANSSETALDRAFSPTALLILRLALWPAVLFMLLEVGAAYFVSKLLQLEGRFATTRRVLTSFGVSLLTTIVLLVPMWWLLERLATQVPD